MKSVTDFACRLEPWCSGSDQPLHCGPWGTHCSETSPVPITSVHNLNCLPLQSYFYLIDLCHFTSISNLISSSKLHNTHKNLSNICILWIKTTTFGEDTEKDSFLSHARTHLLSVSTSFYHGTGFEDSLGLQIPINSAQWWDLNGFAPSLINNLFLNHILQHLTVWQNISLFSVTASHDIQWVTCEYHLQSMYLCHKAIIGLIWGFIKARCCWIWRLTIYGAVPSKMSATCTSKSCFSNTYLTLIALINPASWTVAVKAKRLCGATGAEHTERMNAQWRHTIEKVEVNDAQMRCFFLGLPTCCCWVCTEDRSVGTIWKVTRHYLFGAWIWISWHKALLNQLTEALFSFKGTVHPNMNNSHSCCCKTVLLSFVCETKLDILNVSSGFESQWGPKLVWNDIRVSKPWVNYPLKPLRSQGWLQCIYFPFW